MAGVFLLWVLHVFAGTVFLPIAVFYTLAAPLFFVRDGLMLASRVSVVIAISDQRY